MPPITSPRSPTPTAKSSSTATTLAGQIISLRNTYATPTWYLNNLTYDLFGRQRVVTHGNGTTDTRTYGPATSNFRLSTLTSAGAQSLLNLSYAEYTATGLIKTLTDVRDASGVLCNSAGFTYDGLGRMTQANLQAVGSLGYGFDSLGNMTQKEGVTLAYGDPGRPHTLTAVNGSPVTHDANGNRTGKPGQSYSYDANDRLAGIDNSTVSFVYDYAGQKVAQMSGASVTRYYSKLAEVSDGYLTKHYFARGMRIASQRVAAPGGMAALPSDPRGGPHGGRLVLLVLAGVAK